MANIKVKIGSGTEVIYNNVDAIVMPTTDGGTATFRQWNGANGVTIGASHNKHNVFCKFETTTVTMSGAVEK